MANNNSCSSSHFSYVTEPTSLPSSAKMQLHVYDSDGIESDDDTLVMLSSLTKMETKCALGQNDDANVPDESVTSSSAAFDEQFLGCLDIVQQVIDAVEGTLARCPKYDRRKALTELLTHAKLEQAKKATAHNSDCLRHADTWAAMLMKVQELGRNYPKDPQVHQLVYLVQQCVVRSEKREVPESEDQSYTHSCDVQQDSSQHEHVKEDGVWQQEVDDDDDDDAELCGRMGEAAIDVDVSDDEDDGIGYRITEEFGQGLSNQDEIDATHGNDRSTSRHSSDTEFKEMDELVNQAKLSAASTSTSRLRMLPIMTVNMTVKGVRVPRLPRGRDGGSSSCDSDNANTSRPSNYHAKSAKGSSRHKFQFPEKELLQLLEDDGVNLYSTLSPAFLNTYRRRSTNSKITVAVPLRRKSFSMKRSPLKSPSHVPSVATPELTRASASPSSTKSIKQLWTARRKSTSACHVLAPSIPLGRCNSRGFSVTKQQTLTFESKKKNAAPSSIKSVTTSSPPSPVPSTLTQMVLRVRERMSDGVPELVITKKPAHFITWHWNDRCVRVPFMSAANFMELGPAQHGIMLKQLRYVKSMMHELPWAKAHLRALLSKYTAKKVSKEELYPQLNALGQQVQREISLRAKQHRALTARKQHLTVTLTLATSVVNDTNITKFGRRGRPHASRLVYDPTSPLQLRWRRKHGERSAEHLVVDEIQVVEVPDSSRSTCAAGPFGRGNKRAAAAVAVDPDSCLSLVTPSRSLDLQVASALHREWLANAVRDLVSFAQQYKAVKASTAIVNDNDISNNSVLAALSRRSRQLRPSQNVKVD